MMNRAYIALAMVLMIPMLAHAQDEVELLPDTDNYNNYLLLGTEPEEELWEAELDLIYLELFSEEADLWCDIFLEICLDLEVTGEEICETVPDLWELDENIFNAPEYVRQVQSALEGLRERFECLQEGE